MELSETALSLAELGNETRLKIFRYLVKMGDRIVTVGEIQKELNIPASTLSHHLSRLAKVGLISQRREGRELHYSPNFDQLKEIMNFLVDECCQGKNSCSEINEVIQPIKSCC